MKVSKKCQYALKAVFQLTWQNGNGPVKAHDVADAQQMSLRFTEIILNELKHAGFVDSRRGNEGGYILARDPAALTVREIIEFIEGPVSIAPDVVKNDPDTAFLGNEAFKELWHDANKALSKVYTDKTFAGLVEFERIRRDKHAPNYTI